MIYVIAPVVYSLQQQIAYSRDRTRIAKGTFCMKPAFKLRLTKANVGVIAGFAIEFAQLSYYCLPSFYREAHPKRTAMVEMTFDTSITYITLFWSVASLALLNSVVLLMRVAFKGGRAAKLASSTWVWTVVYFVSGPLYVSIIQHLIRVFDCDFSTRWGTAILLYYCCIVGLVRRGGTTYLINLMIDTLLRCTIM
jgi:hypothetical protein